MTVAGAAAASNALYRLIHTSHFTRKISILLVPDASKTVVISPGDVNARIGRIPESQGPAQYRLQRMVASMPGFAKLGHPLFDSHRETNRFIEKE